MTQTRNYLAAARKKKKKSAKIMGSQSSTRAVGSMLHRISNGVSSKWSADSFALSKHGLLSRNLFSSASSISSWIPLYEVKHCNFQVRTVRTFAPVCMGRRSSKIAGRKVSLLHSLSLSELVLFFAKLLVIIFLLLGYLFFVALLADGLYVQLKATRLMKWPSEILEITCI